ncbi:MAG: ATP-grasp domain-containing protein [Candidatus Rokubacteria bacterium]|nr:ATP-grasp domain-containing protein [Candidatus Rokubacteria bacterium]
MGETWIGVTGLHATDNPHPGLAVIRALRRADPSWRILALIPDRLVTGAFAPDLVDAHALVPSPWAGRGPLAARLAAIVRRHPLDVVIPTLDGELDHYARLRGTLRRLGVRSCLPSTGALHACAKARLAALARRAGVATPETEVLGSADAVWRAAARLRYPQVLKGALVDSAVAHSVEEFRVAGTELAAQWGYPLLAQPLVHGEEYDVAVVARRGELLGVAVMKKLSVTNKGTAWAGVTVEEPGLVAETRRLVRALRWDGGLEAEFIRSPDGRAYCFEINPRFPSWIALAADADANLPALLVRLALGDDGESLGARPGWLFARVVAEHVFAGNPLACLDGRQVRVGLLRPAGAPAAPGAAKGALARSGRVAITGLNASDNPSPGLTVARSLRLASPPPGLVGLTHEVLATGAYVDGLWDEVRLLPFPSREEGGYPDALVEQCRAAGVDCLLPTLDIEIPLVSWLVPRLASAGVAALVPTADALAAASKPRLPALAARKFRLPRAMSIAGFDDLPDAAKELGATFVLKGPLADARVVRSPAEARVMARRLAATWNFPLIAQEYVDGEEFGIAAVADRRHRVVGAVVVRKEIRTLNGNTWGGSVVSDRRLKGLADRFAEALAWVGPFELEVIRHPRRGAFLIEVNPRFPGWVYLSAGAGANLPWAAVRLARGERVVSLEARPKSFYVRMAWDATSPIDRMATLAVEGRVGGHVG